MSTRKRTRSQLHEEDELSPEKGMTSTPLASVKKKKLNANGSSPAGGIAGSLKRTIGDIFGWGRKEKENLREEDEEDELASGESLDSGKRGASQKDIYNFDPSELEKDSVQKRRRGSERMKSTSTPIKTKPASEKDSVKTNHTSGTDDIWEVPEDDTSAIRSSRKLARSAEKAKALLAPAVQNDEDIPMTRPPGRPKKSQILKEDIKLSKKAARERLMATTSEGEEVEEVVITPKKRKSARSKENSPAQSVEIVISAKRQKPERLGKDNSQEYKALKFAASSGKQGPPRRTSIDGTESSRQAPKGILTPSKKRPGRPRKSVTFGEGEVDLGFKDIPGKKSQTSVESHDEIAKASGEEPDEEVEEDEDDVACAICSGLNSTKKNPIIFCDGEDCEYATHKNCEKLAVVPEEDWFCKDCQSTSEPEAEDAIEEEIESDDIEEVACAICSGLDSKAKNPIILCDGEDCDYSVHIKCCQLSTVPRGKWFCEECDLKSQGNALFPQLNDDLAHVGSPNNLPNIEGFEEHLRHMQRTLLDRLTGQKRIRLRGYDEEMKKVHQVVEQTVLAGEGNSMLVIGARGSGKTTVSSLDTILSDHTNET
jgi:origin recognition complex subunit 4